jgi:hypothetical protein
MSGFLLLSPVHTFMACWLESWILRLIDSSWNVMAHGDAQEGKWRGNWRMEWVASTLRTVSEHGVSIITTTNAHTLATSSQLNWCPRQFKWTHPFWWKTNSGFCACAITFQTQSSSCQDSSLTGYSAESTGKYLPEFTFQNCWPFTSQHDIISWKTWNFINTTVGTSNLPENCSFKHCMT